MVISNNDLTLTREGFIKLFEALKKQGLTAKMAFDKVLEMCDEQGYRHRFSSFESFKESYYRNP